MLVVTAPESISSF